MTIKQRFAKIRKKHKSAFRRYITLTANAGSVEEFLDFNAFELREYLESQWLKGMDWDNYGTLWVVDHIVALKYFDPTSFKEMKLCWNHYNLRPNYLMDNHAKGYCVEVTKRVLDTLPKNTITELLYKHIEEYTNMFNIYYQTV